MSIYYFDSFSRIFLQNHTFVLSFSTQLYRTDVNLETINGWKTKQNKKKKTKTKTKPNITRFLLDSGHPVLVYSNLMGNLFLNRENQLFLGKYAARACPLLVKTAGIPDFPVNIRPHVNKKGMEISWTFPIFFLFFPQPLVQLFMGLRSTAFQISHSQLTKDLQFWQ